MCVVSITRSRNKSGGLKDKFRESEELEANPVRPKLVHSLSFSTKHLEETFATYQDVFKVFPYFRININQAKVVSHLVYELKDKNLVKSETYMEFKESLNTIFFKELKFKQFKTSRLSFDNKASKKVGID